MQYTPLTNGTYYLSVSDSLGCEGLSNSVSIDGLAVEKVKDPIAKSIRVTGDEIQLVFNSKFIGNVFVRDVSGRSIYQDQLVSDLYIMNVSSWAQGIYLITLQKDSGVIETHKLFID